MKSKLVGLVLFWIGISYMFLASWFAIWWIAPIWRNTPAEQFSGTIWAFGGPVFTTIALSVPVGILLAVIGIFLHSKTSEDRDWPFLVFVIGGVFVSLSMLFPATLANYPVFFGIAGGLIYIFFFAALWYWGKNQRLLTGGARLAADLQLISYLFFLLTASLACSLLGNPYSGLLFPHRVIEQNALPYHYAMATKMAVYFVLGWFFSFLSQRMYFKVHEAK